MISSGTSSAQRLMLRLSRRRLPSGVVYRSYSPLATTTSSPLFFHTIRRSEDNDNNSLAGLPNDKIVISKIALERSYPLGLSQSSGSIVWYSTTSGDKAGESDKTKESEEPMRRRDYYREKAGYYGGKARHGAKNFGGFMRKYGPVFFVTYTGIYLCTVSGFYLGIESGAMDPANMLGYVTGNYEEQRSSAEVVADILGKYRLTEGLSQFCLEKPHFANLAVAWVVTKFTEPIRLAIAATIVPRIARHFNIGQTEDTEDEQAEREEKETSDETENEDTRDHKKGADSSDKKA